VHCLNINFLEEKLLLIDDIGALLSCWSTGC